MADRNETIKLLKECDAGVEMGITSLDDVIEDLPASELKEILQKSKLCHQEIKAKIDEKLNEYNETGKDPAMMATAMAKMKENMKMKMGEKKKTAANLITDGCNMGVKSLHQYYNQYPNAEKSVKQLAEKLIKEEESLCEKLCCYL